VLDANFLSVPELHEYLTNNAQLTDGRLAPYRTQLAYRWALPWGSLLAVLLAAPLGIIYSRRGLMGSITLAILLFFFLVLGSSVSLALGTGNRISPELAAWSPVVLFGAIGLFMVWMRTTNREVPNLLS
jgi:lipopolysaccharide export system permease protein